MAHLIPVERLTSGNEIIVPGFGFAEVYGVRFDGESYAVDYCADDKAGWDALDTFHVNAGESVEHASDEAPRYLRSMADVSLEEWQAKSDQVFRDNDRLIGELAALQGYVPQPVDEARLAQFYDAMERALFPSLEAAE